jgi:uncharacterized protein HemY
LLVDARAADANRGDEFGVDRLLDFAAEHLGDDDMPDELDPAGRGACRRADEHAADKDERREHGPLVEV